MKFLFLLFFTLITILTADSSYDKGKKIYEDACISCHGVDGQAKTDLKLVVKPRNLTTTLLSQEQSFQIVKEGAFYWGAHSDMMPSFKTVYSDEEITWVTHYIRKAFNPNRKSRIESLLRESTPSKEAQASDSLLVGKKIFEKRCAKCHGILGNGESPFIEASSQHKEFIYPYNLTRTLLTQEQIFLYAKYGGYYWGTHKRDMPAWGKKYKDAELKSVAKYVEENIKKIPNEITQNSF